MRYVLRVRGGVDGHADYWRSCSAQSTEISLTATLSRLRAKIYWLSR